MNKSDRMKMILMLLLLVLFLQTRGERIFFRLILVLQFQSLSLTPNSTRILTANPFGNFHKLILHILKVIHCLSNWLSWESNDENNNNKTWSPIAHSHTQSLWCYRCRSYPFDLDGGDDGGDNVFFFVSHPAGNLSVCFGRFSLYHHLESIFFLTLILTI